MRLAGIILIAGCAHAATFVTQVNGVSNTQAVLSYNHSGSCTIAVSESTTHSPVVHDVDASLFSGADTDSSRTDAIINGAFKLVPIGKRFTALASDAANYSRSLQAYTPHYFLITCGSDTSTGSFVTKNIPLGNTRNDIPQVDLSTPGNYLVPTQPDTRNYRIADPQTGALLNRISVSGDRFGGSNGLTQGFGGITQMCPNQLQTAPGGERGYLCVFWQQDVQYGTLYFVIPATGEWRSLGSIPNGVANPSIDDLMDVYYFDTSPNGLYRMRYNGDFSENGGGAASFGTRELYMPSSIGGVGPLLEAFNPAFSAATYDCGFAAAPAKSYSGFFCHVAGPSQDVTGWLGVWYGGDGRAYNASCSAGPAACPHVVASFDLVSRSCLNHNWQIVTPSSGVIAVNTKSTDGSCTLGGFASMAFCNYLTDPNCTSAYVDAYWPYGGHDFLNGVLGRVTESGGWGAVFGQLAGSANTPLTEMTDSPGFAGASGQGFGNYTSKHPSWMQSSAAPAIELKWFSDFTPYDGGDSPNPAAVSISGDLYSYTTSSALARKQLETGASFGYNSLRDISGLGSSIGTGAGDNYKYCVAAAANECRSGSSVGDIFLNAPSPTNLRCVGGDGPWPFNGDLCISNASSYSNSVIQRYIGDSSSIALSRRITNGMGYWKVYYGFSTAKPVPDASWMVFPVGLGLTGGQYINLWAAKLPPFPPVDTINRNDFVNVPVKVPSGAASSVLVKFGYLEYGGATDYYCTTRAEACVAGAAVSPYAFLTTDSLTPTTCTSGCTVNIPAISGRVLYWQLTDGSGTSIGSANVVVVP